MRGGIETDPDDSSACARASACSSSATSRRLSTSERVRTSIGEDVNGRRRDAGGDRDRRLRGRLRRAASSRRARRRASSTAIATALSPTRLRESRPSTPARSIRGHGEEVVHGAPGERERDEPELHEQHVAVARRPEVVDVRQPQDAQVRPRDEQQGDEHGREPREAQERRAPQLGRRRPDDGGELHEPADPERRRAQVHPVGELGEPRVAGVRRRVAREREPRREDEPEQRTPARAARAGR